MEHHHDHLLEELDYYFRKMVRKFVVERDKIAIEGLVSLPQILILRLLDQKGPHKAGELADELDFTTGAITALCDKLVKAGLIERARTDLDRRIVIVRITEAGKAFLKRNEGIKGKVPGVLFDGFTEEEKRIHLDFCLRILANLPRMSEAVKPFTTPRNE
ncbi:MULTISPECIES: MarR family winged helix-turn-helix transcriptional regulator [Paenibacillus]|uniref:MarR family transcriptional regulator n=1 Tax=Paenibacillus naphthalenovorans TaxID=162209 RepID=A0A0U2VC84_9BACL|nr:MULTISPECIES: MarR family transcriptional regulator [Paenibacillus]ALS21155.1 MarR family transcriptional regulator [Paenibacillus naphthalenovorans]GCL71173.1 MarR family transcriptional regulator [Paenibacillus naphthalenovorans]SDI01527.1 DNA-binding transcriptional regulator, MarR family [Paenibacillus naphthalenovorans]